MHEHQLYAAEGVALTIVAGTLIVWGFARLISRVRPGLSLTAPLIVAFALRVMAAAFLGAASLGASLRGGDEVGFIADAHYVGGLPFSSSTWPALLTGHAHLILQGEPIDLSGSLHVFIMSLQVKLFDASPFAMRVTMAMISVVGLGLLAVAVNELADRRAGRLTMWLLAFEPANVFFSTALHKEPTLYLAEGMVALGGALVWRRARLLPVALMIAGCVVATATRPYAGWFLATASAVVLAHAALRSMASTKVASIALASIVVVAGLIAAPAIVNATSSQELKNELQGAQNANTSDQSNLKLAPVNFSSRGAIIRNLPGRMFDVMFRPFPWQLSDTSQRFGLIETLCVLAAVVVLAQMAARIGNPLRYAGPLIYPAFFLLAAYALASGNAGTSFRYRTNIVALLIPIVIVLRAHATERQRAEMAAPPNRFRSRATVEPGPPGPAIG